MRTRSVGVRLFIILIVVGLSLWALYPPAEKIRLGLDLKGGLLLVLRVRADGALQQHAQDGMTPETARRIRRDTVQQAIATIERRVNELGLTEPTVARYTSDDQILVLLPGVGDIEGAKRIIRATAQLRLTLVENGPFGSREAALAEQGDGLRPDVEILPGRGDDGSTVYYAVSKASAATGADLRNVQQALDEFNRPAVAFTLRPDAARRFGEFTARNINRTLATVIDDRVVSVATIISRIDDRGQIVGLSRQEMVDQVITLKSGALPAALDYLEQRTIGPALGQASIRAGVLASITGLALVTVFMLAYYRTMGVNALVSILLNLLVLVALMSALGAAWTLPGIAGLILTIGMGVDSNILIFERIREEAASASGPRAAVRAAFDRVWVTIVDTHIASLIAAAFLFQFGTGAIRGFATTLAIGLIANVFTAVFVSRTMFELVLHRRK